jgi:hypothetical protein
MPMKKLFYLMPLTLYATLSASVTYAHGRDHHHHHGHHHHHFIPRPHVDYYPAPIVHYYPAPPVAYVPVPPPPPAVYYAQPPVNPSYDQRSPQGLAGGVLGSVFGYELGKGDPIATGLGAAAGSYLGNGIGRGY